MNKFILTILILANVLAIGSSLPVLNQSESLSSWDLYKKLNNLKFDLNEDIKYLETYLDNYQKVIDHNKKYEAKNVTYRVKLNEFSHLSLEETKKSLFGLKLSESNSNYTDEFDFINFGREILPDFVDWSSHLNVVKNQRGCGACWAFATIGVVEILYAAKTNELKRFSEQELIDCTLNNQKYLSYGCHGGWPENGFEYIKQNGIAEENLYPYKNKVDVCNPKNDIFKLKISKYYNIPYGDENALKQVVALKGPVAVGVDGSLWGFEHYSNGIYSDSNCNSQEVNHAVIVVGYGTENGQDYWLVKNSWGPKWGINGYMKLARNKGNMCGIVSMATFATL